MRLQWTSKSLFNLARSYEFLAPDSQTAAARMVRAVVAAPEHLLANPRIGERPDEFDPREVRRILVRDYEIRYEIHAETIYVLRLWHSREDR
ncbi:MAG: type II toxin-antitoxin system RelE/ParE family toxin [Herminiimonas sp.]|nr:type II toxin-antitoxin system RelE/ParE family toxin [Herminiimonas sp.]